MNEDQQKVFLSKLDLEKEEFVIKIADFGFSKKLKFQKQ